MIIKMGDQLICEYKGLKPKKYRTKRTKNKFPPPKTSKNWSVLYQRGKPRPCDPIN